MQKGIVKLIRQGAYDYQAAQASGIDASTFYRWMKAGEKADSVYHQFCTEVQQARAHARTGAEIEVKKGNPLAWLRYGPGRERPGEPGWTETTKLEVSGDKARPLSIKVITGDEEA